jgi:glutathione S-transferase/CDGSH-type Zn-finger protein
LELDSGEEEEEASTARTEKVLNSAHAVVAKKAADSLSSELSSLSSDENDRKVVGKSQQQSGAAKSVANGAKGKSVGNNNAESSSLSSLSDEEFEGESEEQQEEDKVESLLNSAFIKKPAAAANPASAAPVVVDRSAAAPVAASANQNGAKDQETAAKRPAKNDESSSVSLTDTSGEEASVEDKRITSKGTGGAMRERTPSPIRQQATLQQPKSNRLSVVKTSPPGHVDGESTGEEEEFEDEEGEFEDESSSKDASSKAASARTPKATTPKQRQVVAGGGVLQPRLSFPKPASTDGGSSPKKSGREGGGLTPKSVRDGQRTPKSVRTGRGKKIMVIDRTGNSQADEGEYGSSEYESFEEGEEEGGEDGPSFSPSHTTREMRVGMPVLDIKGEVDDSFFSTSARSGRDGSARIGAAGTGSNRSTPKSSNARSPALEESSDDGAHTTATAAVLTVRDLPDAGGKGGANKDKDRVFKCGPIRPEALRNDPIEVDIEDLTKFCRCGQSKKFPFCDNTHVESNLVNGTDYQCWAADPHLLGSTLMICGCGKSLRREQGLPLCDHSCRGEAVVSKVAATSTAASKPAPVVIATEEKPRAAAPATVVQEPKSQPPRSLPESQPVATAQNALRGSQVANSSAGGSVRRESAPIIVIDKFSSDGSEEADEEFSTEEPSSAGRSARQKRSARGGDAPAAVTTAPVVVAEPSPRPAEVRDIVASPKKLVVESSHESAGDEEVTEEVSEEPSSARRTGGRGGIAATSSTTSRDAAEREERLRQQQQQAKQMALDAEEERERQLRKQERERQRQLEEEEDAERARQEFARRKKEREMQEEQDRREFARREEEMRARAAALEEEERRIQEKQDEISRKLREQQELEERRRALEDEAKRAKSAAEREEAERNRQRLEEKNRKTQQHEDEMRRQEREMSQWRDRAERDRREKLTETRKVASQRAMEAQAVVKSREPSYVVERGDPKRHADEVARFRATEDVGDLEELFDSSDEPIYLAWEDGAEVRSRALGLAYTDSGPDILYCTRWDPASFAARFVITKKQIPVRVVMGPPPDADLDAHPLESLPVLVLSNGRRIRGGNQIVEFLVEKYMYEGMPFVSRLAERRSRSAIMNNVIETFLAPLLYLYPSHTIVALAGKPPIPMRSADKEQVFRDHIKQLNVLERYVSRSGPYLTGKSLVTSDALLLPFMVFYDTFCHRLKSVLWRDRPKLKAWYEGIMEDELARKLTQELQSSVVDICNKQKN